MNVSFHSRYSLSAGGPRVRLGAFATLVCLPWTRISRRSLFTFLSNQLCIKKDRTQLAGGPGAPKRLLRFVSPLNTLLPQEFRALQLVYSQNSNQLFFFFIGAVSSFVTAISCFYSFTNFIVLINCYLYGLCLLFL